MSTRLDWARDGANWPHRDASRFVSAAGLRWHVQRTGAGPPILLLHGTGAATHSWAGLLPLLARDHDVIAPDLPGHGFTGNRASGLLSLPWMADAVAALLAAMDVSPAAIVAHSAGAAIAARMAIERLARPQAIVAINGALLPFPGVAQHLFPALAKMLFLNPFVPRLMAWRAAADPRAVRRLIDGTGSTLDARQTALYARLFADPGHVDAALAMMANWDLSGLAASLARLDLPVTLITAERDRAIPPATADSAAALLPNARVTRVPRLGHLAHEEDAAAIAMIIADALLRAGVGASGSATARAASPPAPPRAASDREA